MIKNIFLALIKFYQIILSQDHGLMKIFGPRCRFYPSCSQYAYEAVWKYGVSKGGWIGLKRIFRCHPWNKGGYEPLK